MTIIRRRPRFNFDRDVDRYWFGNRSFASNFLVSYSLLFPDGEQFIIRTCRKFLNQASDPLKADIRDFFFQESQHSRQHEMALDIFRGQGYDIDGYLRRVNHVTYEMMEPRTPPAVALAACAAIEQLNVALSAHFLDRARFNFFEGGDVLGDLLIWHFCEELEHRTVVFNLHNEVHANRQFRSLGLRVLGMYMAWMNFVPLLVIGALYLGRHDRNLRRSSYWRDCFNFMVRDGTLKALAKHSVAYVKPSFDARHCIDDRIITEGLSRIRGGFDL